MKTREREFCRLMTVYADPIRAAEEAGYRKPATAWKKLMGREDIAEEISRLSKNIRSIYQSTAFSGLYQLAYGSVSDAFKLAFSDSIGSDELKKLDLRGVAEIKRTKDKGIEIKLCDRIKAAAQLSEAMNSDPERSSKSGLVEAMVLSAEALRAQSVVNAGEL